MIKPGELTIVWKSHPILNGPLVVRTDLPPSFKSDMTEFHLGLAAAYPQIYNSIERGGGMGYRPVKHADYQMFIDLRKEEAASRRRG